MTNRPEINISAPIDCFEVFSTSDINQMELECMAPFLESPPDQAEAAINVLHGIHLFAELIKRRVEGKAEYRVFSLRSDSSIES